MESALGLHSLRPLTQASMIDSLNVTADGRLIEPRTAIHVLRITDLESLLSVSRSLHTYWTSINEMPAPDAVFVFKISYKIFYNNFRVIRV